MKKKYILFSIAVIFCFPLFAQNDTFYNHIPVKKGFPKKSNFEFSSKGFSPLTAFLLSDLNMEKVDKNTLIQKYGLITINDVLYVNAYIMISENIDPASLSKFGVLLNKTSGKLITGLIPLNKILDIQKEKIIEYIQIGEAVFSQMDAARAATWVNLVQNGYQLPQKYNGSGVVIGIIDGAFDYTHPNFYDSTYSSYRVKRVWEQNGSGTPPSGYTYGRELTTQSSILNAQTNNTTESHGTHVAGIAAGGGVGTNGKYRGVAPQSDLVLIASNMTDIGVFNGIQYIIDYAESVHKPCVINMSLGKHIGPHDGMSAFDQSCDGVVGQGKILVGSAGNEGADPLYYGKTYTLTDTVLYSFVQYPNSSKGTNGQGYIDIWGQPNQYFWVAVNIYNTSTSQFEDWTPYILANSNNTYSYTLHDADSFSPDACIISITTEINTLNNKPRVTLNINHLAQDDNYRWAMVEIIGYNTKTKMWAATGNAVFTANGKGYPWVNGSTNSTIGELGGSGNNMISVGAYTSKNSYTAFNGSTQSIPFFAINGAIASFSSKGPTADGRIKPDITAPGNVIVSSVNHFDTGNYPSSSNSVVAGVNNGSTNWWFATMQGTSMAAPMVTGIIALWLQAYPYLTPTQAKLMLKNNAYKDSYTGTIPSGSNTWGWGKVDAHKGLKNLLTKIPPQPVISPLGNLGFCPGQSVTLYAPSGYSDYYWSNTESTQSINVNTSGSYSVIVANSEGYISPWSLSQSVTAYSNPPAPTISTNDATTFCQGGSALLSAPPSYSSYNWSNGINTQNIQVYNTETFTVQVTDANGCTSPNSSPLTITVNSIPNTPTISLNGNQLISDAPNGNQWYVNWTVIPGETNQIYSPPHNGWYFTKVTINGCTSNMSNEIQTTDVEEISAISNFAVYPNPASQKLYIETLKSNTKLKFEIFNSIGQMVYSSVIDKKAVVDISHFTNGVYDLNIYEGHNIFTKRLIKE